MAGEGTSQADESELRPVAVTWPEVTLTPVAANQFLIQLTSTADGRPESLVLVAGHVTPPIFLGTREEQIEQMAAISAVETLPVAKIVMTKERARELVQLLSQSLSTWDNVDKADGGDLKDDSATSSTQG